MAAALPAGISAPVLAPISSVMGEILMVGLTGTQPATELRTVADWTIRRRLLAVPGVANVALWGERLQMMQVQVDPPKMAAHDVALDEVMETTADAVDSGLLRFSTGSVRTATGPPNWA